MLLHCSYIWLCLGFSHCQGDVSRVYAELRINYILIYLYYNYEKYPLSPLKLRFLALIEQYLHNISDPVYSVHQSFMWFLWLNRCKSTYYPVIDPNDSKCWPIVTSSIQELAASNCHVTMTDCSRVVSMDAFLLALIMLHYLGLMVPCLWWTPCTGLVLN